MKSFIKQAERMLSVKIAHRVNALGGYGDRGEVIYEAHPAPCPSVLVDGRGNASATFMSNGSVAFTVKLKNGMEVKILEGHFDIAEKREINAPSSNLWVSLDGNGGPRAASLMASRNNIGLKPASIRVVKLGDPGRAMWYLSLFGNGLFTAVRLSFVLTPEGPALLREACLVNRGARALSGKLWTHFTLHGTQRFVYNKEIWYDAGLPLSGTETVVSARVPYSDILQIKRVSSRLFNLKASERTCDYSIFIGDTAGSALMPDAVLKGALLPGGARTRLNRFASPAIAANAFTFRLPPSGAAALSQSLLYVADDKLNAAFRKMAQALEPSYECQERAFKKAAAFIVRKTPGAARTSRLSASGRAGVSVPCFELDLPRQKIVSNYANSVWTGVKELYENCRAHGARLADGIEIGTRDRAQDMWPKMKEDPARVRADLVHALSFMYVTVKDPDRIRGRLTLREKLHGMFPRQYPSHWFNRKTEVKNDNRPYTDSPLWLINALCMYVRETGDAGLLAEKVETVTLTDPDCPEKSGITGCGRTYRILEVVREVFACFERHAKDSPYHMAQVLYGDWCDPVDMFGTSRVGDASTRGKGRGVQTRLSAHLFNCIIETLDLLESPGVAALCEKSRIRFDVPRFRRFAGSLRKNVVKVAWEEHPRCPAFLNVIHELKKNGKRPDYARGETGYTLGSMKGRDFDGRDRRELATQAFCLEMLATERPYLDRIPEAASLMKKVLRTVDTLFYNHRLGLLMFTTPIGNNEEALRCVGRMGVVPSGTAENGEYHHCQVFMHRFRLNRPGQADVVWRQFKPVMSAMRDTSIGGPFETPCTSYVSDGKDPHFGKAMYFGLSGSTDWIVEIFQKAAGLSLNLHDSRRPAVEVAPCLPAEIGGALVFRRVIHAALNKGGYRRIPLAISIRPGKSKGAVRINGKKAEKAEVRDLSGVMSLQIDIELPGR